MKFDFLTAWWIISSKQIFIRISIHQTIISMALFWETIDSRNWPNLQGRVDSNVFALGCLKQTFPKLWNDRWWSSLSLRMLGSRQTTICHCCALKKNSWYAAIQLSLGAQKHFQMRSKWINNGGCSRVLSVWAENSLLVKMQLERKREFGRVAAAS